MARRWHKSNWFNNPALAASRTFPTHTLRRLRLTVGYLGTRYAGWGVQSQSRTRLKPTVQGTFEAALARALDHPVRVTAAGRTDAGVHADGQVVSFDTTSTVPAPGLQLILPRWLPPDVWVIDGAQVDSDFDARRSAVRRWYRYAIWRAGVPTGAWHGRCLPTDEPLDVTNMRQAARSLLGRRDFSSLVTRSSVKEQSAVRTVLAADWLELSPQVLVFEICADAYLKQMVRTIVGGLLWVGSAHWTPDQFADSIARADRRAAGPTAPAVGLTLHRIEY